MKQFYTSDPLCKPSGSRVKSYPSLVVHFFAIILHSLRLRLGFGVCWKQSDERTSGLLFSIFFACFGGGSVIFICAWYDGISDVCKDVMTARLLD
jgi:hypothetical protein